MHRPRKGNEGQRQCLGHADEAGANLHPYSLLDPWVVSCPLRFLKLIVHPVRSISKDFTTANLELTINGAPGADGQVAQPMGPRAHRIPEAAKYIPLGDAEESAICLNAMDGPAITPCSHVFYRNYIGAVITCEGSATPGLARKWVAAGGDLAS